ncbi:unnamed protein product, partial [marine sediment metagenome]
MSLVKGQAISRVIPNPTSGRWYKAQRIGGGGGPPSGGVPPPDVPIKQLSVPDPNMQTDVCDSPVTGWSCTGTPVWLTGDPDWGVEIPSGDTITTNITGLEPDTFYQLRIDATNGAFTPTEVTVGGVTPYRIDVEVVTRLIWFVTPPVLTDITVTFTGAAGLLKLGRNLEIWQWSETLQV